MARDELSDSRISRLVELALMEDVGKGDVTSEALFSGLELGKGEFLCKGEGVLAGLQVAALVFTLCDHSITVTPSVRDGDRVHSGQKIALVDGVTKAILTGERTALNFLQRMSGIATMTKRYVDAVAGTGVKITDTRKTAPGLRLLDKWAVRLGGGLNHRFGLDDMVLIKDNHVAAAGSIAGAVDRCRRYLHDHNRKASIEVETGDLTGVHEALGCAGVTRIMLDNFTVADTRAAVEVIAHRFEVEASGGITLDNVRQIAETGVDFISIGALTHSVRALDISLELFPSVPMVS